MSRTILELYAGAVCILVPGCAALAAGVAMYDLVGVVAPAFTVDPMSAPIAAPPTFLPSPVNEPVAKPQPVPSPSPEGDAKRYATDMAHAVRNDAALAKQSLLRWLIAATIGGTLFFVHWQILCAGAGRGR